MPGTVAVASGTPGGRGEGFEVSLFEFAAGFAGGVDCVGVRHRVRSAVLGLTAATGSPKRAADSSGPGVASQPMQDVRTRGPRPAQRIFTAVSGGRYGGWVPRNTPLGPIFVGAQVDYGPGVGAGGIWLLAHFVRRQAYGSSLSGPSFPGASACLFFRGC